jgi:pseudouridylate synthase
MDMDLSPKVRAAQENQKPIVALESTIISHGFPYPENVALANQMEQEIEACGAVPATIAIIEGRIKVGLTEDELLHLAKSGTAVKASVRDLPMVVASGKTGATTVASTAFIAERAGINVFATGGIGGVHRAEEGGDGFDISADLLALSRTKVAVVAAGAKSILDLPATLEVLESYSVPVIGMRVDEFPAFHCRTSGLPIPATAGTIEELAAMVNTHFGLGLPSGLLICNPVPDSHAMTADEVEDLVTRARDEAIKAGVKGAAITPYILGALNRLSNGKTSEVNHALALNNGRVAAKLAVALTA